jgi:hypothetical protein
MLKTVAKNKKFELFAKKPKSQKPNFLNRQSVRAHQPHARCQARANESERRA